MKKTLFVVEMTRSLKMPPFGNTIVSHLTIEVHALSLDDALTVAYTELPQWKMLNCFESKGMNNVKAND